MTASVSSAVPDSQDPLDALPRVTYANAGADFSGVHALLDQAFEKQDPGRKPGSFGHWIGSRSLAVGEPRPVASPTDSNRVLGERLEAPPELVDRAVAAARAAAPGWRRMPWADRVAHLRRAARALRARRLEAAVWLVLEVGKSRLEALGEIEESIDLIEFYCDAVEKAEGWEYALGAAAHGERGSDRLRPYGVFAVIAPFNYPVALALGMASAALLAGNCVVFKPAAAAVLSGRLLCELAQAAGLPEGVFNMLQGGAATGQQLASHPGVDGIAFTGSHDVGMALARHMLSGAYARPVLAELGGKNAAFVTASALLEDAALGVARSAFGMSGQKCSACSRVFVEEAIYPAFVELLVEVTGRLRVANPIDAAAFTGPVINAQAGERFAAALAAVAAQGAVPGTGHQGRARVRAGGRRLAPAGPEGQGGPGGDEVFSRGIYLEPTIVEGLPAAHELHTRELFLPFLTVQRFTRLEDAIAQANASPLGLTAGIYTRDEAELDRFLDTIEAGVLYANRASGATTGAWPGFQTFCGWKGSGLTGKGGLGLHYVQQFAREQSRTLAALRPAHN